MWREPRGCHLAQPRELQGSCHGVPASLWSSKGPERFGSPCSSRVCSLAAAAHTGRASRQWCPCDVPFAQSQLRYSTADIIRLLKQGICNLCFPAMVTVHRVNPKDLFFNRYMVAVTVAALTVTDVLV